MSDPICPRCSSTMLARKATRGRNAGNMFYGCSNYPKCKGTLSYETGAENNRSTIYDTFPQESNDNFEKVPRAFIARSKFKDNQVKFYDTIAVHQDDLKKRSEDNNYSNNLERATKWRVDYPISYFNALSDELRSSLAVIEKILLRGNVTRLSEKLESLLMSLDLSSITNRSFNLYEENNENSLLWFDGYGVESKFYSNILPNILGPDYRNYVIPQVYISSLINGFTQESDEQRVDFLICLPNKKIIVELDGAEHKEHIQKDQYRENLLEREGYIIHRIPNEEVLNGYGPNIEKLNNDVRLINIKSQVLDLDITMSLFKFAHQVQVCLLEAINSGIIDINKEIYVVIDGFNINIPEDKMEDMISYVIEDFLQLANNVFTLYGVQQPVNIEWFTSSSNSLGNSFCISYNEDSILNCPTLYVQNILWDQPILISTRSYAPQKTDDVKADNLRFFLQYVFRKEGFREGQLEAITKALTGNDAIVLLPTGHGKSISFQLASLLLPGISVVIDPIISLIDDQIENLKLAGIDRCVGITSQISNKENLNEIITLFSKGQYHFCYIAPERFQTKKFREALRALTVSIPICLIAVDEAHCVSEWGHDFRTSYLNIGRISREYCSSKGFIPPLLALTGTASRSVLKDVIRVLQIEDFEAIITPTTFNRPELKFEVIKASSKEKFNILQGILNTLLPSRFNVSPQTFYQELDDNTYSGLVFCPHVNGDYGVFNISKNIQSQITSSVEFYSGSKPKYLSDHNYGLKKKLTAHRFKNNKVQVLVATKAFGMGIDKPNIRFTVHYGIPGSIEAFYQEAGRAGRDRNLSHCIIIYSDDNLEINKALLDPNSSYEKVQTLKEEVTFDDDISRSMFFHTNAFKGIIEELENVEIVLEHLPDLTKRLECNILINKKSRNELEKGLHRLLTLGVVIDYTIDYSSNEFTVYTSGIEKQGIIEAFSNYVSGYHRGRMNEEIRKADSNKHLPLKPFIVAMSKQLITFIYDVIEKSRRRSLSEMSILCNDSTSHHQINERILQYLQTEYSESIEILLDEEDSGLEQMKNIVESVRSTKDANSIRGEVSRYLESYPDQPGLLFLRGIIELFTLEKNTLIAEQNITAAISNGFNSYDLKAENLYETIGWMMSVLSERDRSFVSKLLKELLIEIQDKKFLRQLMLFLPNELNDYVALKLLTRTSEDLLKIFEKEISNG